jgi:hypothetical protein
MLDSLSLYLANLETNKGNGMFLSIDFLLATTAIAIMIVCYVILLVKLKPANESSESSEFSNLLQETYEEMPVQRRVEMLEKVKEERIKEYLNRKKQKLEGS